MSLTWSENPKTGFLVTRLSCLKKMTSGLLPVFKMLGGNFKKSETKKLNLMHVNSLSCKTLHDFGIICPEMVCVPHLKCRA